MNPTNRHGIIKCRNCGKWRNHRARGLCYQCYKDPAVLANVSCLIDKSIRSCAKATQLASENERPLPPTPTTAMPGTLAKVLVMEDRYSKGFHIHHPLDAGQPAQANDPELDLPISCLTTKHRDGARNASIPGGSNGKN